MTATNSLTVSVLGPITVAADGRPVPVGGPKPLTVVALLTMYANQVVPDDRLIDAVWPAGAPSSAARTLYTMVSRLRAAVNNELTIDRVENGYRLVLADGQSDVSRVEELARRAQAVRYDDPPQALATLTEALATWRGRPYGQFESAAFAAREVARLQALRLSLIEQRADVAIEVDPVAAVAELEGLVLEHPLQERLWGQLMLALHRAGRTADALAAFQQARTVLATELGLEPGVHLQRLQQQVLVQDPALQPGGAASGPAQASELPTGPGVLLFAGISRWGERLAVPSPEDRDWLTSLWRTYDELVRARGGIVFGRQVEQRRAVFAAAGPALEVAWEALRLTGPDGDLPVLTLAVHRDELVEVAGDYLGTPVNRSLELLRRGGPGVVAASTPLPVPAAVTDSLGDPPAWVAAGPEGGPYLLGEADAVAGHLARSVRPDTVRPGELTSFVGRQEEQRTVVDLWQRSRLVTLCGIGGIGKTRLATRILGAEASSSGRRCATVELAPLREESLVLREVAVVLGVGEASDDELGEAIAQQVGDEPFDLVLDNCEHLQRGAARVAERLLRASPSLRILATSREPLQVPGEVLFRLPPLDTAGSGGSGGVGLTDAARLFLDRARDHSPGLTTTTDDLADVRSVCERLDGIPLAIELVAARVRHLGIADLAEQIDARMALVIQGENTRPTRHQTLRAAIDWSWDLLAPDVAGLFAELSVFAGGWSLAAADAVGSSDRSADLLAELVDKSLVVAEMRGARVRYRMLETVRVYAGDRLTDDLAASAAREAHARWFTAFARDVARTIEGPDFGRAIEQFDVEQANLRAALRWGADAGRLELVGELAAVLAPCWIARGLAAEGAGWLDLVLDAGDAVAPLVRMTVLEARADLAMNLDVASAQTFLDEAVEIARVVGDDRALARVLSSLGLHRRLAGDVAAAEVYDESLRLYRELGDVGGVATLTGRLGDLAFALCDGPRARAHLEEAALLHRQLDQSKALCWILGSLALVETGMGGYERAEEIGAECLRRFTDMGDTNGRLWALCALGEVAYGAGRHDLAEERFSEALSALVAVGDGKDSAWALEGMGRARLGLGDVPGARDYLHRSLDLALDAQQQFRLVTLVRLFGLAEAAAGEWEGAAGHLLQARALREESGRGTWPADWARDEALLVRAEEVLGAENFARLAAEARVAAADGVAVAVRSLPRR